MLAWARARGTAMARWLSGGGPLPGGGSGWAAAWRAALSAAAPAGAAGAGAAASGTRARARCAGRPTSPTGWSAWGPAPGSASAGPGPRACWRARSTCGGTCRRRRACGTRTASSAAPGGAAGARWGLLRRPRTPTERRPLTGGTRGAARSAPKKWHPHRRRRCRRRCPAARQAFPPWR